MTVWKTWGEQTPAQPRKWHYFRDPTEFIFPSLPHPVMLLWTILQKILGISSHGFLITEAFVFHFSSVLLLIHCPYHRHDLFTPTFAGQEKIESFLPVQLFSYYCISLDLDLQGSFRLGVECPL